jgi:phospholipid/cholesterol/gamma-HCH transport system permease protein
LFCSPNSRPFQVTKRLEFDASQLTGWDTGLITFLLETSEFCPRQWHRAEPRGFAVRTSTPDRTGRSSAGKEGARSETANVSFFERTGNQTIGCGLSVAEFLGFLGDVAIACGKFVRGKAHYPREDLLEVIQECGSSAAGIVSLMAFLVGVILAFMGAIQLSQFGGGFMSPTWSESEWYAAWAR